MVFALLEDFGDQLPVEVAPEDGFSGIVGIDAVVRAPEDIMGSVSISGEEEHAEGVAAAHPCHAGREINKHAELANARHIVLAYFEFGMQKNALSYRLPMRQGKTDVLTRGAARRRSGADSLYNGRTRCGEMNRQPVSAMVNWRSLSGIMVANALETALWSAAAVICLCVRFLVNRKKAEARRLVAVFEIVPYGCAMLGTFGIGRNDLAATEMLPPVTGTARVRETLGLLPVDQRHEMNMTIQHVCVSILKVIKVVHFYLQI